MHITSHKSFHQKSNNFFHSAFHCLINGNLRLGCWRTMGSRGWGDKVHICLETLSFGCSCVAGHSPQLSCSQYKVLITVGGTRVRMLLSDLSKYWPRCNSLTIYPIFSQVLAHSAKYSITLLMLICWFSAQRYVIYIILHTFMICLPNLLSVPIIFMLLLCPLAPDAAPSLKLFAEPS